MRSLDLSHRRKGRLERSFEQGSKVFSALLMEIKDSAT